MNTAEKAYEIWQRIDLQRQQKPLSTIAEECGIKYQRIKEQRSSNRIPSVLDLYEISKYLGISMEYLVSGSKETVIYPLRVRTIADACMKASEDDLKLVERVLRISSKNQTAI